MNDVCISALRHSEPEESAAFTVRQGVPSSSETAPVLTVIQGREPSSWREMAGAKMGKAFPP